jgi:TolA-binding protein
MNKRIAQLALIVVVALASSTRAATNAQRIDAFVESVKQNESIDDATRAAVLEDIAAQRKDADLAHETIADAVRNMYPDYRRALVAFSEDDMAAAVASFRKLSQSDDPFLAAHASYYLAQTHVWEARFEQAKPLLADLVSGKLADKSLYGAEAAFMLGVCHAELLERKEARQVLESFIRDYPDAPERMLVGALHLLAELATIDEGSIIDVHNRMTYVHRRLDDADTGERPQDQQKKIITMLDKLIEEAEKKEQQGGGGGGQGGGYGPASGNNQPNNPAEQSTAPVGESRIGDLHRITRGKPGDQWGQMKDRDREAVLNAIKGRFPDRYKELVKQYYESLQNESGK